MFQDSYMECSVVRHIVTADRSTSRFAKLNRDDEMYVALYIFIGLIVYVAEKHGFIVFFKIVRSPTSCSHSSLLSH